MPFIAINANNEIVATSITDDINLGDGESIIEVPSIQLPDQVMFCDYVGGEIVVNETRKEAYQTAIADKIAEIDIAKKALKDKYKDKGPDDYSDTDALAWTKLQMYQEME